MESSDLIRSILERANSSGDLPILNASIAQVRQVSADPDAHAMKLAETILRDANLTTRVLRIANSPSYNRGTGRIATVSRAVVLLGFETIRNLCLTVKLIEAFQVEHPAIGMHQMLARAYLTAGFVRDLAIRCGIRDAEETYLCGLLHNLGEIAVAYFAPQQFNVMTALQKKNEMTWTEAQRLVLGTGIEDVGQQIATSWKFAPKLVATMAPYQTANARLVRNRDELSHALTALGGDVIGKLYVEHHTTDKTLRETFRSLSEIAGTTPEQIEQDLTNSFQASCGLAAEYGLPSRILQPILRPSEDDLLSRLAREFGFYATKSHNVSDPVAQPQADITATLGAEQSTIAIPAKNDLAQENTAVDVAHQRGADPVVQLAILQEVTAMVVTNAPLNTILMKVLEGIYRGVGLERAVLALPSPDGTSYQARVTLGKDAAALRSSIAGSCANNSDPFVRVMAEASDLVVNTSNKQNSSAVAIDRADAMSVNAFMASGLRSHGKAVGFFYGDNGNSQRPITEEQQKSFQHFVSQARLAIQLRG